MIFPSASLLSWRCVVRRSKLWIWGLAFGRFRFRFWARGSGGGRVRAGPRGGGCGGAEGFSAGDGLTGGWWSGGCGAASGRTSERTVLFSLLDAGDAAELDRMSGCGRVLSFFLVKQTLAKLTWQSTRKNGSFSFYYEKQKIGVSNCDNLW